MSNIYIYDQGTVIGYRENRITIKYKSGQTNFIPIENIDSIIIFGGIQVTTACMQNLLLRGINLTLLSKTGSYFGKLESTSHINIFRQKLQFKKSEDNRFCLELSKQFIKGKTKNQKTILLRANKHIKNDNIKIEIENISKYIKKIDDCIDIESLMGIEGYIAKLYYKAINIIIDEQFSFQKRTRRPPKDPFNAILSFGYTLLHYEIFSILSTKGLNPYIAFFHSDKHKHPALCSDLMEELRPILVDSLTISLVNSKKINIENFNYDEDSGGVFLNREGCKKFIEEFEKRLKQEVSYIKEVPYKMNFRKIMEYQVMLLINSMQQDDGNLYKSVMIR